MKDAAPPRPPSYSPAVVASDATPTSTFALPPSHPGGRAPQRSECIQPRRLGTGIHVIRASSGAVVVPKQAVEGGGGGSVVALGRKSGLYTQQQPTDSPRTVRHHGLVPGVPPLQRSLVFPRCRGQSMIELLRWGKHDDRRKGQACVAQR